MIDPVKFKCPACGQLVVISSVGDATYHELPVCSRWEAVETLADVTKLLQEANDALAAQKMADATELLREADALKAQKK